MAYLRSRKVIMDKQKPPVIYIVTLVIFITIALIITLTYMPDNIWLAYIAIFGSAFIHFILTMFVKIMEDKKFHKEHNQIKKAFDDTNNAEAFLHDLSNMQHSPKMKESINRFYLSMAIAWYRMNKKEKAVAYIFAIQASKKELDDELEEITRLVKGESHNEENEIR